MRFAHFLLCILVPTYWTVYQAHSWSGYPDPLRDLSRPPLAMGIKFPPLGLGSLPLPDHGPVSLP
jgi:hypothetical protein